ncbi:carboxymuconolactone decarboxylase family protein [Comamonas sp. B-9]|uniref:carboxymuconolactone decarboxylase family protein n=1 Tax=Comamonas sp. B-9 TaxID=1055192 RepID=UPI0003955B40|nr:carboxymuconolactone decarboxylase family protein [Comamonas sp. B-9]
MAELDTAAVEALYRQERGYWRPWNAQLLARRPAFLQAYAHYAGYTARSGGLSERMVELVYVALDASASHLFASGLKLHMQKALACGASDDDLLDVLTLVCLQGAGATAAALDEVAQVYGLPPKAEPTEGQQPDLWARLQAIDPAYFGHLQALASTAESGQGLSAGERCLITIALHACFTASQPEALRAALQQAKGLGVAREAVVQVIQMGAHLAVHGTALGITVLAELDTA